MSFTILGERNAEKGLTSAHVGGRHFAELRFCQVKWKGKEGRKEGRKGRKGEATIFGDKEDDEMICL